MKLSKNQFRAMADLDPQATKGFMKVVSGSDTSSWRPLVRADLESIRHGGTISCRFLNSSSNGDWRGHHCSVELVPTLSGFSYRITKSVDGQYFDLSVYGSDSLLDQMEISTGQSRPTAVSVIIFDEELGCFRIKEVPVDEFNA